MSKDSEMGLLEPSFISQKVNKFHSSAFRQVLLAANVLNDVFLFLNVSEMIPIVSSHMS